VIWLHLLLTKKRRKRLPVLKDKLKRHKPTLQRPQGKLKLHLRKHRISTVILNSFCPTRRQIMDMKLFLY
jgi:transposase